MHSKLSTVPLTLGLFLGLGPLVGLAVFIFANATGIGPALIFVIIFSYPVGVIPALLAGLIFVGLTKATERVSGQEVTFSLLAALYGGLAGGFSTSALLLLLSPAARQELPLEVVATGVIAGTLCGYFSSLKQQELFDSQKDSPQQREHW